MAGFRSAPQPQSSRLSTGQCLVAGFDTVRSIVAARAWSALTARFALTNSGHFRLCRTAHWADVSLVCHGLTGRVSESLPPICKNPEHPKGYSGFLWSKWRDYRASLARNLNRRCSRLERARRSFRLIRSPLFAYGDAPLGRRSARSPTALQAACPNPRLDMQNPGYPQGASGILCRSGGIRTRGLLVPNRSHKSRNYLHTWYINIY